MARRFPFFAAVVIAGALVMLAGDPGPLAGDVYYVRVTRVTNMQGGVIVRTISGPPETHECQMGWADSACVWQFAAGTQIEVEANPISGYKFRRWIEPVQSDKRRCQFSMNRDRSVRAEFEPESYAVSVVVGGSGGGTVTSAPSGINCTKVGGTCSARFKYGTNVTLTVSPKPGSEFSKWGGKCTGMTYTCSFAVAARDESVSATLYEK